MDTRQERLSRLDSALLDKRQICSSEGVLCAFPSALKSPFMIDGVGLIICRQGNFTFILNQKTFSAKAGDTLFLPKDSLFQVLQASDNVEVYIFIYQTDPIRDFMGNSVVSMHLYSHLATEPCYVWNTGEEEEVLKYLSLLDSTLKIEENPFNRYEQKLLLLALTHRLCSVYTRKLIAEKTSVSHKHDIFIRLVQLIEQYYTKERGGGLLRGQAMPVAQIPLRPLQIHLRIYGTGAGIQVHYPQKHFTTQEYTKERTGNLRFLQLPERILFRHFLQETDWNVATAIPQNVGKHHIAITLSVE